MRRVLIGMLAGVLCMTSVCFANNNWFGFEYGMEKAKNDHKLVMLKFESPGCGSCADLELTFQKPDVAKRLDEFVCIRITSNDPKAKLVYKGLEMEVRDLMKLFQVHGRPALVFLTSDGDYLNTFNGSIRKKRMVEILDAMRASQAPSPAGAAA